jgi:hypothetical protein
MGFSMGVMGVMGVDGVDGLLGNCKVVVGSKGMVKFPPTAVMDFVKEDLMSWLII